MNGLGRYSPVVSNGIGGGMMALEKLSDVMRVELTSMVVVGVGVVGCGCGSTIVVVVTGNGESRLLLSWSVDSKMLWVCGSSRGGGVDCTVWPK